MVLQTRQLPPVCYTPEAPTLDLLILPPVCTISHQLSDRTRSELTAEIDPTREKKLYVTDGTWSEFWLTIPETALTVCTTRLRGQLHTILEDMVQLPNVVLEEFRSLHDIIAEDRASNAQEEARQMRKEALEEVVQQIYHASTSSIALRVAKELAVTAVTHAASTQRRDHLGSNYFPE
ncbi:hypothetical protein Tco_0290805 [Tanacetum coccineum]